MAIATTVINDVLSRMRDSLATLNSLVSPPSTASGRAFVLTLVNHCMIAMALGERLIVSTSDMILQPNTVIYDLDQTLAGSDYGGRVLSVSVTGVGEVDGPVDYKALGRTSRTWLTDTNNTLSAPLSFAPIGCTLMALYPAFTNPNPAVPITIRYVQAPPFLTLEGNTINIPDYAAGRLARLVALVDSIKLRQLTNFEARLQDLAQDIMAHDTTRETGGKAD